MLGHKTPKAVAQRAAVAQLAEQLICNQQAASSNLAGGSSSRTKMYKEDTMALAYLKIFADMEETLTLYSDEERGRLLSAMMAYSFRGEEPEFAGAERFIWPTIRRHIDACEANNEKQKANGKRGGRPETQEKPEEPNYNPTKPNETQGKPNETQTEAKETQKKPIQDQDQEPVHDQDHKGTRGKRTRFVPPMPEEVQAFMLGIGGTHVQAARFHAYYASNGWKVGKGPMKDWQAAARGWILRDKEGGFSSGNKSSPPQQNKMLRYTPEERKKAYSAAVLDFDEVET